MVGMERSRREHGLGEPAVGGTPPEGSAAVGDAISRATAAEPLAPEAFAVLFREYARYVASIGTRILGPDGPVDDLVQDVFLAMYQDAHRLREQGALKGWLATVASRLAWRQVIRAPGASRMPAATLEDLAPLESVDASPEDRADVAGLLDKLRQMPVPLREPWLLRHIEGETLPRIAELCECSQSTVQRRLREANEALLVPRARRRAPSRK